MRSLWTFLCIGWLGIAAAGVASSTSAEDDAAREQAVQRLDENWASVQSAQARLAALEAAYSRGMTSRDLVGEPREKLVQAIAAAKREIAAARAAHGELFEAARRSGVPWSVLDRYEALPAPPAAPRPAPEGSPDDVTVDSENVDTPDDAASEDSDDLRATSRDPD